jgi:hypothetical protein
VTRRHWTAIAAAVLGVGLALAPVGFRMFERAPKGGDMIHGFAPYMHTQKIDDFRQHLASIGAARDEARNVDGGPAVSRFVTAWPAIDADMSSMLDTMEQNIGHYRGVAALPPFPLFPWFFVIPGVLAAGLALFLRRPAIALAVLGIGLLAAPAMFQMFTRAPGGAAMIEDFKPFMTHPKVNQIQGYFLTIGTAEAALRRDALPGDPADDLPATRRFSATWPAISADMAPMIGAMADNVDNFDAVAALPPFGLFPWFFVAPGLVLVVLAAVSRRAETAQPAADTIPVGTTLEGATR